MAENETRVLYKAFADFTNLHRAATRAKRAIKELREEEAKLNAQSVSGAASQQVATQKLAKSQKDVGDAYDASARSATKAKVVFRETADAANKTADATRKTVDATKQAADAQNNLAGVTRRAFRETVAGAKATEKAAEAARSLTGVTRKQYREMQAAERANSKGAKTMRTLHDQATRLNSAFTKLGNWRPRLTPPFIALIPIIAGVIGLINPLVAGLGAVGAAAFGFAVSLGSVAGAALAVVPALGSLLSIVFALKAAFGGIGGAFKAFSKMKEATGGGSGKAELTQTEEITRAQERYARAIQNVAWAQEDLSDARKDYIKRLKELQKAVDQAAMSEARAAANSRLAQENYANVLADPGSTKGQKMDAKVSVDEAGAEYNDVLEENKKNLAELEEMKKKGIDGDRQVIQAQRNLTDAIWAQRDAQLELINAQKGQGNPAAEAANAYREALAKLSPSARKFVETIVGMREEWVALQKRVQERFFSKFVDDVGRLRLLFGPLETLLGGAADALGRFVDNFILLVTSPAWQDDITLFGENNVSVIDGIGDGLISVLDAFRNIAIVAQEVLLMPMAETFRDWAAGFAEWVETGRTSGGLAEYLEGVRDRLAQWWRIIKNVGMTLFNYGSAAGDFADWITSGLEAITEGWRKNSEDALKEGSPFQQYLEDIKPLLSELRGLVGDFFGWFAEEAMDKQNIDSFLEITKAIREELGPAIGDLLDRLGESGIGEAFIDAISRIVEIITILAQSPAVETFFGILNGILDFLKFVVGIPGVGAILGGIAAGFAAIAAVSLVGKFSGLTALVNLLLRLSKGGKGLPGLLKGIGGALAASLGIIIPGGGTGGKGGKGGKKSGGIATGGKSAGKAGGAAKGLGGIAKGAGRGAAGLAGGLLSMFGLNVFAGGPGNSTVPYKPGQAPKNQKGAGAAKGGGAGVFGGLGKTAGKNAGKGADVLGNLGKTAGAGAKNAGKGFNLMGSIAKGAAKGAGIGAVLSIAGTIVGDLVASGAQEGGAGAGQRIGGNMLGGVAGGAGIGGLIGSVVPGIGTAIGAGVGALAGGAISFATSSDEDKAAFFEDLSKNWNEFWGKAWPDFWAGIGSGIADAWQGLGTAWNEFWGTQWPLFWQNLGDGFVQWIGTELPTFLGEAWGNIQNFFNTTIPTFFEEFGLAWDTYWNVTFPLFWENWGKDVSKWFADFGVNWDRYWGIEFPAFWTDWGKGFDGWLKDIGKGWDNYWNKEFPDFWKGLADGIGGFFGAFGKGWDDFWGGWGSAFNQGEKNTKDNKQGDVPGGVSGPTARKVKALMPGGMRISSAYRTPAENRAVGGSSTSYHMDRNNPAVDIVGSKSQMASFATLLGRIGGWRQLYYNGVKAPGVGYWPDHWDHIHVANTGGQVPGRGNGDTVPSMLTPGEFVIKKSIVNRVGPENLARFNSGVMSFADLLRQSMNQPGKKKQAGGMAVQMFSGGGLVLDTTSFGNGGSTPPPGLEGAGGGGGYAEAPVIAGDLIINNPAQEAASDSLPRSIRKVAYLGGKK